MSGSPSKVSKLEMEALVGDLDEPMDDQSLALPERKRRASAASSSIASSIGVRTIIHEEVQALLSTNVLGPLVQELQQQMQDVRLQQQETINSGRQVVSEIQKAMVQQQTMQKHLEAQLVNSDRRQKEHERALVELSGEAYGSYDRVQQLRDQHALTRVAVQHLHQHQVKLEGEHQLERGPTPPEVAMQSSSSSMEMGRDSRGLGRPVMSQHPPPVLRTVPPERSDHRVADNANPPLEGEGSGSANRFLPNAKIAQIPVFDVTRFTSWRREMCFWKDLHDYLPEKQIISFVGLNGVL